jgi:hypothetical protein
MQIRVGYELIYECPRPTPMLLTLNTHFSRVADIVAPDHIVTSPSVPITPYRDEFGNLCSRIVAPSGQIRISTDAVLNDSCRFRFQDETHCLLKNSGLKKISLSPILVSIETMSANFRFHLRLIDRSINRTIATWLVWSTIQTIRVGRRLNAETNFCANC